MVDRQIVYSGAIPQDTDLLLQNKNTMIGLGYALQAILGSNTIVDGLACTATVPPGMTVNIAPGSIYSVQNVDGSSYGSLASDTTHQIVKQGIIQSTTNFSCPAPATTGQSIVYLIQAAYQDTDSGSTVLPYYNASNPAVAYNGPGNSGTSQNTVRQGVCLVQRKAGIAASTGSQATPSPDAGFVGLFAVTVANGQTTITSGNISQLGTAPFIPVKLPDIINNLAKQLSANTSFYVATTGNDSTGNGTSGSPWATRQHAWDTIKNTYNLNGYTVTINIADGTYADAFMALGSMAGATGPDSVQFVGNTAAPANVVLNCSTSSIWRASYGAQFVFNGCTIQSTGGVIGVDQAFGSTVKIGANVVFGSMTSGVHIQTQVGGQVVIPTGYTISGGASSHWNMLSSSQIYAPSVTIALTGTPTFSIAFLGGQTNASASISGITFTGSATGTRYILSSNATAFTNAAGASYLPGNATGTTSTGGQYI